MENDFRVLIAACDTFRAGAVEQLRTHMHHLNALHPPERHNGQVMVELFEQVMRGKRKKLIYTDLHTYKHIFDIYIFLNQAKKRESERVMLFLARRLSVLIIYIPKIILSH